MSEVNEITRLAFYICHINDRYAAEADGVFNWKQREMVVTVDQGGKTIYAATLRMDSEDFMDQCASVRKDLEQMIADCELPILFNREAVA